MKLLKMNISISFFLFKNYVVKNLKNIWFKLKVIHGKPRHVQLQGNVERTNRDTQKLLFTWHRDRKRTE